MSIRFQGVSKTLGGKMILRDLSFEATRGEILFILGKSGMGKSLILKHVVGLMKPDCGQIWVNQAEITALSAWDLRLARQQCGMVFQHPALLDGLTVAENVALGLQAPVGWGEQVLRPRLSEVEIAAKVREKLGWVQLDPYEVGECRPGQLSLGIQKRVALARALACDPQSLLFDEPTTGLDPPTTLAVHQLIAHLSLQLKVTAVVVSHDIQAALRFAHKVLVLDQGRVLAHVTPQALVCSPEPLIQAFLSSQPAPGEAEGLR